MFLLPIFLLLFPRDSISPTMMGIAAGVGQPFGGYGLRAEVLQKTSFRRHTGISGSLGLGNRKWFPDREFHWIGNALTINWERGQIHRIGFSAGLASSVLAKQQDVSILPVREFLIGPMGSVAYVYRAEGGFYFTSGISLNVVQRALKKEMGFVSEFSPYIGFGWSRAVSLVKITEPEHPDL
jgi:hypothetical protein